PQPPRRSRLHARPLAGRPLPGRARVFLNLNRSTQSNAEELFVPVKFSLVSGSPTSVRADLLVVPVFAEREFGPGADEVDAAVGGGLLEFMTETGFEGKPGETLAIPTN